MLVLDANVAVAACAEPEGFADLGETELVAPPISLGTRGPMTPNTSRWRRFSAVAW
jgi:hypothetical protein